MSGKQVRLFLVDGSTTGLMTAEIMNWTGHLISAPRSEIAQLLSREETKSTGVYILLGDDRDSLHDTKAYVGEGDCVADRLKNHAKAPEAGGKEFWDRVIVITSKDANITKAHARYLEGRIIQIASRARRASLENGTAPAAKSLPEADRADMEYFIEQLKIVLPVLGVQLLREARFVAPTTDRSEPTMDAPPCPSETSAGPDRSPIFRLRVARNPDLYSLAQEVDSEFVVAEGSFASKKTKVMVDGYLKDRETLIRNKILVEDEDQRVLRMTDDYVFSSPSAAASVMNASSVNGVRRWLTEAGQSYGEWQEARAQLPDDQL